MTDISRFYHSIYTHSIPWAIHGKGNSKSDTSPKSKNNTFNQADYILRNGQDGQTVGLPVGPDISRVFAEIIGTAIDLEFQSRCPNIQYTALRHVDDVWIGTNSYQDAENCLWKYREAIREFELDINESKTHIFGPEFKFSDMWPSKIAFEIHSACESERNSAEWLRAALENVFSIARQNQDEAALKFAIRYIDRRGYHKDHWETIEPFLRRSVIHYGHTIDYIAQILVWRVLVHNDIKINLWSDIISNVIDKHSRLGNDSEVCWALYVCMHLNIKLKEELSNQILRNCGALPVLMLLNMAAKDFSDEVVYDRAAERLSGETAKGVFWPVFLEPD